MVDSGQVLSASPLGVALDVEEVLGEVRVPVGVAVGQVDRVPGVGEGQGEGQGVGRAVLLLLHRTVILVIPGQKQIEECKISHPDCLTDCNVVSRSGLNIL